jgi:isoamylase
VEIWPGQPYPLGATFDGSGTNFALFSEVAERVELCLFDADGTETRAELTEVDAYVWHGYLPTTSSSASGSTCSTSNVRGSSSSEL